MSMSPTSPTFNRGSRRFSLALVEDPLLATAASYPTAPQSPLTPPEASLSPMAFPGKTAPEEAFIDDCNAEAADAMSIPEQEPNLSQSHLLAHAKVYAIAEK